ncbi:LOB domain-containing protein 37 [Cicer arietinum]|uniref:LOB domain-containing protein 37 isoform X1 n=1 Tax=Cicer arietinum TaxID=3827 RepID=A0A1S2YYA3_CICAR|nr:LOB domain-containing protein 37 isoform X1 [Cicer arietinum]
MSCNGCRVLRKGCSESCILRPCLQWIDTPEAQGHATVFVAKFFGRADLMSFISNVPQPQRPALFQSLLLEACGRTVNPVNGAVGLLWTGNWHVCQAAVETVLRGGTPRPIPEFLGLDALTSTADDASEGEVTCNDARKVQDPNQNSRFVSSRSNKVASGGKRKRYDFATTDLNLRLTPCFLQNALTSSCRREIRRPGTPSMNSEESVTTMTSLESGIGDQYVNDGDRKVLNLFV